ncbi:hypothetical protein sos41_31430 [Alphaproteobacteria bacterium SO-S41]|nr:hypothetical protein sos41_31430 [Alphaproteobacteria bacterium SO-S41]
MSYLDTQRRHLRLSILLILKDAPQYRCNDSILRDTLQPFGFDPSRDQVRGELTWLAEQNLVEVSEAGKLLVAKATQHGVDVAAGRARHPDVQRPGA